MFWEALRKLGLNPHPVQGPDRIPQFYDTERGVSFLGPDTAAKFLYMWAEEHGKEFQPLQFVYFMEGEQQGLHCELTVAHEEFGQSQMLRHATGTLITWKLSEGGKLLPGESLKIEYAPITTKDGRGVVKLTKLASGKVVNFDP